MKTKPIIVALATLLIGSLSLWACQNDDIVSGIPDMTEHIALKSGQAETAIFGSGIGHIANWQPLFMGLPE